MAEQNLTEEWRPIPGYEGLYEVSSLGRVKQVAKMKRRTPGRIMRQIVGKRGYPTVMLHTPTEKSGNRCTVHRLVMAAFHGPSDLHVNHISAVRTDNRLENLEYCTPAENVAHTLKMGHTVRGERHPHAKLTEADVLSIRRMYSDGETQADIAAAFGVTGSNVSHIVHDGWTHIGSLTTEDGRTGARKAAAKLTDDDVRAIRKAVAGGEARAVVAARYGVHRSRVTCIVNGTAWANVI